MQKLLCVLMFGMMFGQGIYGTGSDGELNVSGTYYIGWHAHSDADMWHIDFYCILLIFAQISLTLQRKLQLIPSKTADSIVPY